MSFAIGKSVQLQQGTPILCDCVRFVSQQRSLHFSCAAPAAHFSFWEGQMEQAKPTGYPSVDKPWLKYYSEEIINAPLPDCTIYEYLVENNRAYPKDIAIHYLGRRITYGELFKRIDETAAAFAALGVQPGEIVTVALPSIPEALYAVYALNKIGAATNMIHPLAGEDEIIHYLNEVESRVAILFDGTYKLIGKRIGETSLKHAIVVSAGDSLLFGLKQFYYSNNPKVRLPQDSVFHSWTWFLKGGKGTAVPTFAKDPDTLALISHTVGTTGEPKGVMCSDRNINALIWQIVCNFEYKRQYTCLALCSLTSCRGPRAARSTTARWRNRR
jgi:long-chain acyl-CoA synthetase